MSPSKDAPPPPSASEQDWQSWRVHLLLALVFVSGAVFMAMEIVGGRIVAATYGSTIFVWGTLIGIFMGALSLGYYLGGRLADRSPKPRIMGIVAVGGGVSVVLLPLFGYGLCRLLSDSLFPDSQLFSNVINPMLSIILLFTIPGVLIAILSPYAIRLNASDMDRIGRITGRVYGISALGSIAGSLLVVFFLMSVLPNRAILWSAGGLLILAGTATALLARPASVKSSENM